MIVPARRVTLIAAGHDLRPRPQATVRWQRKRARTATLCCAFVFALAMGLSRIYLGDHWLTDVLVAWTLGLGWLTVVITAHRLLLTLRKRDAASQPPDPIKPASDA
jgi:membrane-associated phospholipid phosphatase